LTLNNIAAFSSRGPSRRPDLTGLKPDISAPGELIFSAFSSSSSADNKNKDSSGDYVKMEGTSMATPVVTGLTALLLEANPNLNPNDVKQIFKKTAVADNFVGTVPNVIWGNGKVDGLASVKDGLTITLDTETAIHTDTSSQIISTFITAGTSVAVVKFDSSCAGGYAIPEIVKVNLVNRLADGSSGDTITLDIEFKDRDLPVFMTVKNNFDTITSVKINSAANSIIDFGGNAAYQAALNTVREISFIRNGLDYNSENSFNKIKITYTVPAALKGYPLAVYSLDEIDSNWKILPENNISYSTTGNTISAELQHFSSYGLFAKGIRKSSTLSDIVVFPNPYRPNDGNELTGTEFSGSYNIDNKTGIHITGLTSNSIIKIYDISGRLASEIYPIPNSGMAIWDGRLKNGEYAPTGLYFVLTENEAEKHIEKLAIIR
nr:S8 family serine peptidase [Candidatus Dependentiae bacterium]